MSEVMVVPPLPEDQGKHDLTVFKEANEKKITWDERLSLIKKQFPSVAQLDWTKVFFQDPTIWGNIVNDILKVDAAPPGRPGKRPAVDAKDGGVRLRQMLGDDHTSLPFYEALILLKSDRSIRHLANKVGLDRNYVYKLMKNQAMPTASDMEKVAKAFGKRPEFFHEYRMAYVFAVMWYRLDSHPDVSVSLYRKVKSAS